MATTGTASARVASRAQGPVENSGQLLKLLRETPGRTTSELAAALGVARSTILQRLELLTEHGLVENGSVTIGSRGRPAVVSRFRPGAALVLAAHVGLTGSRLAATDLAGEVVQQRFLEVSVTQGQEHLLGELLACFDEMVAAAGRRPDEVAGMGVALPSTIDLMTFARSTDAPAPDWDHEALRRRLRDHIDAPAFLDLDVNLLALAERRKSWADHEVFVCVKLGTLIDASIVINGRPVHGVNHQAGELGHMKVSGSTVPCTCGSVGCLDAVASGSALVRQLRSRGVEVSHVSEVVALARRGDPEAIAAVREAGRQIGEALASVVNLLNPGVISAWGYLTEAEAVLFAGIRAGLYQTALPGSSDNLQLVRAALGDLAGVRGAASMVIDHVLDPQAVDRVVAAGSWSAGWTS